MREIVIRQPVVHDQQAGLDEPYGNTLHLLNHQHHLGAEAALRDVVGVEGRSIVRVDEVAAGIGHDVHTHNQYRIRDL